MARTFFVCHVLKIADTNVVRIICGGVVREIQFDPNKICRRRTKGKNAGKARVFSRVSLASLSFRKWRMCKAKFGIRDCLWFVVLFFSCDNVYEMKWVQYDCFCMKYLENASNCQMVYVRVSNRNQKLVSKFITVLRFEFETILVRLSSYVKLL